MNTEENPDIWSFTFEWRRTDLFTVTWRRYAEARKWLNILRGFEPIYRNMGLGRFALDLLPRYSMIVECWWVRAPVRKPDNEQVD